MSECEVTYVIALQSIFRVADFTEQNLKKERKKKEEKKKKKKSTRTPIHPTPKNNNKQQNTHIHTQRNPNKKDGKFVPALEH